MRLDDQEYVIGIDVPDEAGFSTTGCENCSTGLGGDVYTCTVHTEHYKVTMELCINCIVSREYGEPLPDGCRNIYNI